MGSGCNTSSSGNFFEKLTPDTGIVYTGPAISALGICTGDRLNEIEAVLLQKVIDYSTGVGISIPNIDLTTCEAFVGCITCCGTCTDLPCLLECYKNTICTIWGDLETLKDEIDTLLNGPYNATCLTGITTTSPLNVIIQQLITEFCNLKTAFGVLQTSVNGFVSGINTTIGNFLTNSIKTCQGSSAIEVTNSGASVEFFFKGFVPIGGIISWAGDTVGKFDSTGNGITNTDWCGWAICNGNNGTPNMLGLIPVMATNISIGTPQPISGRSFPYSTIGGEYEHTLTGNESGIPLHGHTINDPGHDHFLRFKNWKFNRSGGGGSGGDNYTDLTGALGTTSPDYTGWTGSGGVGSITDGTPVAGRIGKSATGISVNNSGPVNAQSAHENVQPYIALYYIQRIK
jgi:hypothetical protein